MNIIVFRQWFANKIYPILFGMCIMVSLAAFLTLDALQNSVDEYIIDNQKQIVGGDIILTHNQAWPDEIVQYINTNQNIARVYDYQFNSIAFTDNDSILTRVKGVSSAYPLYGELELAQNTNNWPKNSVLVERQVLNTLNISIGDSLKIGENSFVVHDEIITEPDRPLTAFGFGARVIMHESDLEKTALMGQKSRINYRIEIKIDDNLQQTTYDKLTQLIQGTEIKLTTADQANTSISNLSQNFLVFLKLLVIAVIILSAIGVMSIIRAFVNGQKNTNAIRSALGEKSDSIIHSYRLLFGFMALASTLLAWAVSLVVIYFGADIFSSILPKNIVLAIGYFSVLKALIIALSITALMAHISLKSIKEIKPVAVLHKHQIQRHNSKKQWFLYIIMAFACVGLLYTELNNLYRSFQILFGFIIIWIIFLLLTKALMGLLRYLLNKRIIKNWRVVLALQNIFRKGNQSNLFITSLSITTMILGSITILDHSIQQQLISTYPEDSPNLFLLDIQPEQQNQLDEMFSQDLTYYPVIRARIDSVNGIKAEVLKDSLSRYDNISRMFNLSYSNNLLITETLDSSINSDALFSKPDEGFVSVSILNSFAEFLQVKLADKVTFNVQGIKIKAQISSIRKRLKRGPSPFFYFIFPPDVMKDAPQIRFATTKVNDDQRIILQTDIAKLFPGITTLDGGAIANKLKDFVDQLKQLVQIFTLLSLIAGLLIFLTSLVSTSQDRLNESFYYRMMGMKGNDMLKLTIIEFQTLGLFAFILGAIIASIVSALIVIQWFSLDFIFPWQLFLNSALFLIILLLLISVSYNNYVRKSKVIDFLRHADGSE